MEALIARPRTISDPAALRRARACIVDHGPGVSLATLAKAIGLSPPALVKRFGSKEHLVLRALLPTGPPRWRDALGVPPGDDPHAELSAVLVTLCEEFREVGPALAALRMSRHGAGAPPAQEQPALPILVRHMLAAWLEAAGASDGACWADAAAGAAEARGFLSWVGPELVDGTSDQAWAHQLAALILRDAGS